MEEIIECLVRLTLGYLVVGSWNCDLKVSEKLDSGVFKVFLVVSNYHEKPAGKSHWDVVKTEATNS